VWDLSKHINSLTTTTSRKPPAASTANAAANALFDKAIHAIETAATLEDLVKHFSAAKGLMSNQQEADRVTAAKDKRKKTLMDAQKEPPEIDYGQHDDAGDRNPT
jgi:hypothetical protein